MTREVLSARTVLPNTNLRRVIDEFTQERKRTRATASPEELVMEALLSAGPAAKKRARRSSGLSSFSSM